MEKSRLEIKVGLFVFIGLVLLAVLLIQFSKGTSLFRGTYELRLHADNVGGLKPRAGVLLAGVQVGTVSDIQLAPDGKSVTILLKIYKDYKIYQRRAVRHRAIRLSGRPVCRHHPDGQPAAGADQRRGRGVRSRRSTCRKWRAPRPASSSALMKRPKNWTPRSRDLRRMVLNEQTLTNFAATHRQPARLFRTGDWTRCSDIQRPRRHQRRANRPRRQQRGLLLAGTRSSLADSAHGRAGDQRRGNYRRR